MYNLTLTSSSPSFCCFEKKLSDVPEGTSKKLTTQVLFGNEANNLFWSFPVNYTLNQEVWIKNLLNASISYFLLVLLPHQGLFLCQGLPSLEQLIQCDKCPKSVDTCAFFLTTDKKKVETTRLAPYSTTIICLSIAKKMTPDNPNEKGCKRPTENSPKTSPPSTKAIKKSQKNTPKTPGYLDSIQIVLVFYILQCSNREMIDNTHSTQHACTLFNCIKISDIGK